MERRFSRENSREKGSIILQKKILESKRPNKAEPVPDLTDFMNDMFYGSVNTEKKSYNLTGSRLDQEEEEEVSFDDSTRSNSSRLTQEWLEEARRIVASSPTRGCDSPSRLVGSPRFAAARLSSASILDRRDPLSRSARRHAPVEGVSGEILIKSAKHGCNKSESYESTPNSPTESSPASHVQKWFSNFLKPPNSANPPSESDPSSPRSHSADATFSPSFDPTAPTLPPRLSVHRKSRFQTSTENQSPAAAAPQDIPVPPRRTFKPAPLPPETNHLLSPPKNLIESAHRRTKSSSTCSLPDNHPLSPPRNLVESVHRRSISKCTCSLEQVTPMVNLSNGWPQEEKGENLSLNGFLKERKNEIEKILNGEFKSKAKVILSGPSNSTSSMVAALCYAWLLENRLSQSKGEGKGEGCVVIPVINVRRGKMWRQRQAAWLFHHVGLDATSLLFADEVDLETLMMEGQLNILVVGQDILKTNAEVGSHCTILTDNYCEDAYDLLQTPMLKKLLLAGILLDTQNLNASGISTTRDGEAVQLLLVGSAPNYRNALFDQLMQDQRDNSFFEALRHYYEKPPTESKPLHNDGRDHGAQMELRGTERKSSSVSSHTVTQNTDKISNNARSSRSHSRDASKSDDHDHGTLIEQRETERKSTSVSSRDTMTQDADKKSNNARNSRSNGKEAPKSAAKPDAVLAPRAAPAPAQAGPDASRGKNKFFLAKWFNWGNK